MSSLLSDAEFASWLPDLRALSGTPADLALRALAAGCDLALYCAGDGAANSTLLAACPEITRVAADQLADANALAARRRLTLDPDSLAAERDRLLA